MTASTRFSIIAISSNHYITPSALVRGLQEKRESIKYELKEEKDSLKSACDNKTKSKKETKKKNIIVFRMQKRYKRLEEVY